MDKVHITTLKLALTCFALLFRCGIVIDNFLAITTTGYTFQDPTKMADGGNPLTPAPEERSVSTENTDGTSTAQTNRTTDWPETKAANHKFDPNFTQNVINAAGPKAAPRTRKVMASLIQHIHDFARENEITVDEWMAGVEMVRPRPFPSWRINY